MPANPDEDALSKRFGGFSFDFLLGWAYHPLDRLMFGFLRRAIHGAENGGAKYAG